LEGNRKYGLEAKINSMKDVIAEKNEWEISYVRHERAGLKIRFGIC
jgi:hypothetical protein